MTRLRSSSAVLSLILACVASVLVMAGSPSAVATGDPEVGAYVTPVSPKSPYVSGTGASAPSGATFKIETSGNLPSLTINVRRTIDNQSALQISGAYTNWGFSPSEKTFVAWYVDPNVMGGTVVRAWRLNGGSAPQILNQPFIGDLRLGFDPNGNYLMIAGVQSGQFTIKVLDATTGAVAYSANPTTSGIGGDGWAGHGFSPEGGAFFVAWRPVTDQVSKVLVNLVDKHTTSWTSSGTGFWQFSPCGNYLADVVQSGPSDTMSTVRRTTTGDAVFTRSDQVAAISFRAEAAQHIMKVGTIDHLMFASTVPCGGGGGPTTAAPRSVSGGIFRDINANGVKDTGEVYDHPFGSQGWIRALRLDGQGRVAEERTISVSTGQFSATSLTDGRWILWLYGTSWSQTFPERNQPYDITISSTTGYQNLDFGEAPVGPWAPGAGSVSGRALRAGGLSADAFAVELVGSDVSDDYALTTDAGGHYSATGLPPGPYTIMANEPSWMAESSQTSAFVIVDGGPVTAPDILVAPGRSLISGTVFEDSDEDGVQDPGEVAPTASVHIRLAPRTVVGLPVIVPAAPVFSWGPGLPADTFDLAVVNDERELTTATSLTIPGYQQNLTGVKIGITPEPGHGTEAPGAPAGFFASIGNQTIAVSWSAATGTVTGYVVEQSKGGTTWTPTSYPASARSATITGLTNGSPYRVRVHAVNGTLAGPSSAALTKTPNAKPARPRSVKAAAQKKAVKVSWRAGTLISSTGRPTGFTIQVRKPGSSRYVTAKKVGASTTSMTIAGLKAGKTYRFRLVATNAVGSSPASGTVSAKPKK